MIEIALILLGKCIIFGIITSGMFGLSYCLSLLDKKDIVNFAKSMYDDFYIFTWKEIVDFIKEFLLTTFIGGVLILIVVSVVMALVDMGVSF